MRPFPQPLEHQVRKKLLALWIGVEVSLVGCGIGGCATVASKPSLPPPANQSIEVTVTPTSGAVLLGNQIAFSAAVTNTSDTAVLWSVNGVAGGNAAWGMITGAGVYTAPADLPAPAMVRVTAKSHADATKSASATVTVRSDVAVTLGTSAATVELGASRAFVAAVSSSGHPDKSLVWSLTGAACPLACGSVDPNGTYTAPQILPVPASVTLTARSVADPSKQASTAITVTSNFVLQLSVPSTVAAGATATSIATLIPVPGSNPSSALTWSLSGSGCSGISCGSLSVVTTQSAGGSPTALSASYVAPGAPPTPDAILVTVTPQAEPSKAVQQSLTIQGSGSGGLNVIVSPAAATRAVNHHVTLTAQISGLPTSSPNSNIAWNVNGVAGGTSATGLICVVGSNPCERVTSGSTLQVDYVAPAEMPAADPVIVQAVSAADVTKSGTAQITVINHVVVSVLPGSVALTPLQVQQFVASVLGSSMQNVVWQVQGTGCAAPEVCGAITPAGVYTAPAAAPAPDSLQVQAISSDDTTQFGVANVSVTTGANILTLHPASVYAGAADGFLLKVSGSGFVPSVTGASSTLLIGGTVRPTTCSATDTCVASANAADVALNGNLDVQVQNPDGTRSNVVSLVVAPPNVSDEIISLTAGAPNVTGKDLVVVEPTTAGVSVPGDDVDLNVGALGIFSVANNSCTLGGNPVALVRPASGTFTADICLFAESGLDASMTYTVSGPGDVAVLAKQPLGLGIMRLTLTITAGAAPSARTLFIQNPNLDKTAASGTLRVE